MEKVCFLLGGLNKRRLIMQFTYSKSGLSFALFWTVCLIATFQLPESFGQRTNPMIYEPISGSVPCFRRLNGTHQTGCSCKFQTINQMNKLMIIIMCYLFLNSLFKRRRGGDLSCG